MYGVGWKLNEIQSNPILQWNPKLLPVEEARGLGPQKEDGEEEEEHGGGEGQQRVAQAGAEEEQPGGDGGRQQAGADVGPAPLPQHHVPNCMEMEWKPMYSSMNLLRIIHSFLLRIHQ